MAKQLGRGKEKKKKEKRGQEAGKNKMNGVSMHKKIEEEELSQIIGYGGNAAEEGEEKGKGGKDGVSMEFLNPLFFLV
jgi:hypothetical protein